MTVADALAHPYAMSAMFLCWGILFAACGWWVGFHSGYRAWGRNHRTHLAVTRYELTAKEAVPGLAMIKIRAVERSLVTEKAFSMGGVPLDHAAQMAYQMEKALQWIEEARSL